jgi:hypothetical protein
MKRFCLQSDIHKRMSDESITTYLYNSNQYVGKISIDDVINKNVEEIAYKNKIPIDEIRQNLGNYIDLDRTTKMISEKNDFRQQFGGSIFKYIDYQTNERINQIKDCGWFWYQDDFFLDSPSILKDKKYFYLSLDRWLYYSPRLIPLIKLIEDNPCIISDCGISPRMLWRNHIMHCYNVNIYNLFIDNCGDSDIFLTVVSDLVDAHRIDYSIKLDLLVGLLIYYPKGEEPILDICKSYIVKSLNNDRPVAQQQSTECSTFWPVFSLDRSEESIKQEQADRQAFGIRMKFGVNIDELDLFEKQMKEKYRPADSPPKSDNDVGQMLKLEPKYLCSVCEHAFFCGMDGTYRFFKYFRLLIDIVYNIQKSKGNPITINDYNQIANFIKNSKKEKLPHYLNDSSCRQFNWYALGKYNEKYLYENYDKISERVFYNTHCILNEVVNELQIPLQYMPYNFNEIFTEYMKKKYNPDEEHNGNFNYDKLMDRVKEYLK